MQAHPNPPSSTAHASLLHAFCFDCGWPAPQWRRLLGIGARFYSAPEDDRRIIIKCMGAYTVCEGDALIVAPRTQAAER